MVRVRVTISEDDLQISVPVTVRRGKEVVFYDTLDVIAQDPLEFEMDVTLPEELEEAIREHAATLAHVPLSDLDAAAGVLPKEVLDRIVSLILAEVKRVVLDFDTVELDLADIVRPDDVEIVEV